MTKQIEARQGERMCLKVDVTPNCETPTWEIIAELAEHEDGTRYWEYVKKATKK